MKPSPVKYGGVLLSDKELEAIRQKKLRDLQERTAHERREKPQTDDRAILSRVFRGRAWEVFNAAQAQFPAEMLRVEQLLVDLTQEGKITEIEGEQLYALLRQIGLPVRLNTTIRVLSQGKTESLADKFRKTTK